MSRLALVFGALCAVLIVGCGTLRTVRKAVFESDSIDGKDKIEYATLIEEKEAEYREFKETNRMFMPYHYASIALIFSGIAMLALKRTSSAIGIGTILGGVGISAWAVVAPNNVLLVTVMLSGGLILAVAYIGYRLIKPKP